MNSSALTLEKEDFIRECLGWAILQPSSEKIAEWIKWARKRLGEKGGVE